jgi:hypothetical protein
MNCAGLGDVPVGEARGGGPNPSAEVKGMSRSATLRRGRTDGLTTIPRTQEHSLRLSADYNPCVENPPQGKWSLRRREGS